MDIAQLILDDHAEQRRLFALIEEMAPDDTAALAATWRRLRTLLDTHAEAEERFFYPTVLHTGEGGVDGDSAEAETKDAIEDHNEIRDTGEAVERHAVSSADWFAAVGACNKANSDHMAEEERQGLTDMRRCVALERRHALGVQFVAFEMAHLTGVRVVDKDPAKYVEAHK